ncbi:hypothetical protein RchiOBHm_Chr7g0223271 [Rosa chinensis]|uniref:Uncharacterized protein n=1 Tax=Rosa chinensis TaxID=74649 RepID=A0A2P6PDJ2_ROSCH|nr:hypothetical protein RchiOBHm_Chr7g0223271 [Rosa chinensis]
MAKSAAAAGRKRKSSTSVSDLEITDAANLLIQLSGSSDTIYYDAEEESVGKTTPTAHPDDHDQVSSNSAFKYRVFEEEEEDEVGFGKPIEKKRFRFISDLYERTKPLKNGGVVNRRKRMMV